MGTVSFWCGNRNPSGASRTSGSFRCMAATVSRTRDLEIWSAFLKDRISASSACNGGSAAARGRRITTRHFDMYREIDLLMRRMGIKPGDAIAGRIQPRFGKSLCGSCAGSQQGAAVLQSVRCEWAVLRWTIHRRGQSIAADSAHALPGCPLDHVLRRTRPQPGPGWLSGHAAYRRHG